MVKEVDLKIEKSKIYRNLDILDEREKEVVVGRFGLDTGGEERTQWEIAKELGISWSYVSLEIAARSDMEFRILVAFLKCRKASGPKSDSMELGYGNVDLVNTSLLGPLHFHILRCRMKNHLFI